MARVYGMSLLQATELMRGTYDAGIPRIGLKDVSVAAGGSGGDLTTADIDGFRRLGFSTLPQSWEMWWQICSGSETNAAINVAQILLLLLTSGGARFSGVEGNLGGR